MGIAEIKIPTINYDSPGKFIVSIGLIFLVIATVLFIYYFNVLAPNTELFKTVVVIEFIVFAIGGFAIFTIGLNMVNKELTIKDNLQKIEYNTRIKEYNLENNATLKKIPESKFEKLE